MHRTDTDERDAGKKKELTWVKRTPHSLSLSL
jgi:hypothetical protein